MRYVQVWYALLDVLGGWGFNPLWCLSTSKFSMTLKNKIVKNGQKYIAPQIEYWLYVIYRYLIHFASNVLFERRNEQVSSRHITYIYIHCGIHFSVHSRSEWKWRVRHGPSKIEVWIEFHPTQRDEDVPVLSLGSPAGSDPRHTHGGRRRLDRTLLLPRIRRRW